MTLDSQLLRTTGTIYGELMRDSGISLPDGRYISQKSFISALRSNGVGTIRSRRRLPNDIRDSRDYGNDDNILTGVEYLLDMRYTFNPWKELRGYVRRRFSETTDKNPRAIVATMKDLYSTFYRLPPELQAEFLQMVQSYPCEFDGSRHNPLTFLINFPDLYRSLLDLYDRMRKHVPDERLDDFNLVIQSIVLHNICIDKGDIIRTQIESLAGFDKTTIPTSWEEGHLKPEVIAKKREELSELLLKKKD